MTITKDKERLQKKLDRIKLKLAKKRAKLTKVEVVAEQSKAFIEPLVTQEAYLEAQLNLMTEYE